VPSSPQTVHCITPQSCHREGRKPVAIYCDPGSLQTNRIVSFETRWIAASLAPLSPRNDKVRVL